MSLNLQATALYERGDFEEARGTVERFLQLEALDHTQFGDGLLLLSTILCAMQLFEEAERMAATCHGYLCEHMGPTHRGVAAASLNRSIILLERYYRTNDLHTMVAKHALTHRRGGSGSRLLSSASIHGQSSTYSEDSSSGAVQWVVLAKRHLDEAFEILQDSYGVERLLLADVLHNLGCCDEILGTYSAAMDHYMRSLKIRGKFQDASGTTDLKLAQTMEHVAMVYRLTESKLGEAQKLLGVVANTRRRYLGPLHPAYAAALLEQGVCAYEALNLRSALTLLRRCHQIRSDCFGPSHPETIHIRKYLDALYAETGWRDARTGDIPSTTAGDNSGSLHAMVPPVRSSDKAAAPRPGPEPNVALQRRPSTPQPQPTLQHSMSAPSHDTTRRSHISGTLQNSRGASTTPNESVELDIRPIEDTYDYFQPLRRAQTTTASSLRGQPSTDDNTPLERGLSAGSMPPLHPRSARN
jgi:tetratricopeptide (TPR) repeat protein